MSQKIKAEITMPEWLKEVTESRFADEEAPPGFMNRASIKRMLNCGETTLNKTIREGMESGRMERVEVLEMIGSQRRRIPYYGPKRK